MATDWQQWWANRAGQIGGATVTPTRPQPEYGAAVDLSTAPMSTAQYQGLVNDVQTVREEEDQRQKWYEKTGLDLLRESSLARSIGGGIRDLFTRSNAFDPDSEPVEMNPVARTVAAPVGDSLEWWDQNAVQPAFRGLASGQHALNISGEQSSRDFWLDFGSLAEGETWQQAWARSENSTLGQAYAESIFLDRPTRQQVFLDGFDEQGRPLNLGYRELRENNAAFNLLSGGIDFAKAWYLAPDAIALRGIGMARAIYKGDFDRMTRGQQNRVRTIMTTPSADIERVASQVPVWDIAGRRAVALRQEQFRLRDEVRAGNMDAYTLAGFQAFETSAQGATAAHLFAESAKARKIDPATGSFTDEFDDDLFETVTAAMFGHPGAMNRLLSRADEFGDGIKAMYDDRITALDDVNRWSEKILDVQTTPHLTDAERKEALIGPQWRLDDAVARQTTAEQGLARYVGYEDWVQRALTEGPQLNMAPREATSVGTWLRGATAATFRPTGHSNTASQVIQIPRAAWLQRPGIVNLHSGEDAFNAATRYLDQAAYYGRDGDLTAVANEYGADDWNVLVREMGNGAAGASNDIDRLSIMERAEAIAVESIARKYGLTSEEALAVKDKVSGLRADLITQAESAAQKSYSQAKTADGKRIDAFRHVNSDGSEEIIRLPVDVTQLRNTFIGIDLRVLDQLLSQHSNSIKAALWDKPVGAASDALEAFNHYWKPTVLFRMGYPVRNVIDDGARALAATMSATFLIGSAKAVVTGGRNLPNRAMNRLGRTRGWFIDNNPRREQPAEPLAIAESLGPVDAPDPKRLNTVATRRPMLTKFEQRAARAAAKGKPVGGRIPAIIRRFDDALRGLGDDPVAIDAVTGRPRAGDKWTTVLPDSLTVYDTLDARTLTRYVDQYDQVLSNPGNALLVRKMTDGRVTVSIGRRGVLPKNTRPDTSRPLRQTGEKPVKVAGVEFEGPFGPTGDAYRPANSSEMFNRNLYRSTQYNLRAARQDNLQRTVHIGEAEFEGAWAALVNDQIRTSPILRRMLDGATDEEIVRWLGTTADGRRLAKRIPHKSHNPVRWVDELRLHLNYYLPSERLRLLAREGDLNPDELRNLGRWDPRPTSVDTAAVKMSTGEHSVGKMLDRIIDAGFKALATVPSDTLVRNPFFERNYTYRLRQMMALADTEITPQVRRVMERQAREYALRQTRRYMFSLADQSEATHMLRFLMPFIGSWQESLTRWFRVLMERPETFSRLYMQGWEKGLENLWGVETYEDPLSGDEMVRVPMPKPVMKGLATVLPGVAPEDLEGFENLIIPKQSINVTLQGSPWWLPGGGPLVQMPAAFLLANSPELENDSAFSSFAWKWLFPAGRPSGVAETILPTWVQQARRYHAEGDDPVYNNLGLLIYKNDYQRWKDAGQNGPEPTIEESFEKAKGIQLYYTAGRLGSPFAFRLEPASQLWIDKAREYRELYGHQEGLQRFVDEMGEDAYLWWESLSQTNLAVPPTSEGFTQYKRYKEQIEQFPELASVIVGLDAADADFNSSVYQRQQELPVSTVDPRRQRSQQTAPQMLADVEAQQGWVEYRNWRAGIDAELVARGLPSINSKGAEDLLVANRIFVDDQKEKLPGWARDYETFDSGRGYAYVDMLRDWIESGGAPITRPDVAGIAEYVQLHDAFAAELDVRQAFGGSRNIETTEDGRSNVDLAVAWEMAVGELVERNPMFAEVYHRYLERHTLRNGSN